MKKIFGLCLIVIALVIIGGCTQTAPAKPVATPVPTTETATEVPTATPEMNVTAGIPPTTEVTTAAVMVDAIPANATKAEVTAETTIPAPAVTKIVTTNVIHIRNNTFVPVATTVLPGTGITWVNDDKIVHSVKASRTGANIFNSGDIAAGSQWSYTFGANEVTYTVIDPEVTGMTGTVIVKKGQTLTSG